MFSEAFQKEENHGISSIFIPVHLYATVDIFEMVCLMLIAYNLWFPCWIPEALFLIINWGNPIQSGASRQILSGDGDGDEDGDGDRDALSKTKLLKAWEPKAGGALLYYYFFFVFLLFRFHVSSNPHLILHRVVTFHVVHTHSTMYQLNCRPGVSPMHQRHRCTSVIWSVTFCFSSWSVYFKTETVNTLKKVHVWWK